jgi:hypothetical protein
MDLQYYVDDCEIIRCLESIVAITGDKVFEAVQACFAHSRIDINAAYEVLGRTTFLGYVVKSNNVHGVQSALQCGATVTLKTMLTACGSSISCSVFNALVEKAGVCCIVDRLSRRGSLLHVLVSKVQRPKLRSVFGRPDAYMMFATAEGQKVGRSVLDSISKKGPDSFWKEMRDMLADSIARTRLYWVSAIIVISHF